MKLTMDLLNMIFLSVLGCYFFSYINDFSKLVWDSLLENPYKVGLSITQLLILWGIYHVIRMCIS